MMTRKKTMCAAWACVAAAASVGAARADEKADRAAISQVYKRLSAANGTGDVAVLDAATTSDFTYVTESKLVLSKSQAMHLFKENWGKLRKKWPGARFSPIKIQAFASKNSRATVISYCTVTLQAAGPDGRVRTLQVLSQTRDFWRKDGAAWKEYRIEEIVTTAHLDGRQVPLP